MTASEQHREIVSAGTAPAAPGGKDTSGWAWTRHPEFWIAVTLGAVLRLWALDSTHFLFDQATLMTLAREAVQRHAVPVAGLASSIHTFNPPLSVYFLLPFALLDKDPLPAVVSLALWNVLGVALCYIFALRFFGRRVAAVGSLLFAAGPAAVLYSRFLWPQNYLPPLVALFALALYAGCIQGRRGMLAPAVALLALGALLHPTMLLLAPALLAGVLLAPHRPRWGEYVLSAVIVAALLAPTLVWEAVSGWSDLRLVTAYTSGHAKIDPEVFFRLYEALGAPGLPLAGSIPHAPPHSLAGIVQLLAAPITNPSLGTSAPYAAISPLYVALGLAASLLFAVGWITLTWRVLTPAWALWRGQAEQLSSLTRIREWVSATWRGLRAGAAWRAALLLWLLVTVPLALLIRHSSAIFTHYLIILYPCAFLTMAFGALALAEGAARLAGRTRMGTSVACALVLTLLVALILGQAAQSLLYTVSIATGQFDARIAGYGYPLGALQQADARLTQLQRQIGATSTYVAESPLETVPMDYALVREHPDRVGFMDACLVLPAPDARPALVVAASDSLDARALATLPNAGIVAEIAMAGNAPLVVYRVAGTLPAALPGEIPLAPVRLRDAAGQGLQLDTGLVDGAQLRLRWTVLGSTPPGATPLRLRTLVRDVSAAGQVGPMRTFRDCAPTRWETGDTMFAWLPLPHSWNGAPGGAPDAMLIQGQESTAVLATPTLGPILLLSSKQGGMQWQGLAPLPPDAAHPGGGHVAYGGVLLSEGDAGRTGA